MNLLERIVNWAGIETNGRSPREVEALAALEHGQRCKRSGQYREALVAFEKAAALAEGGKNQSLPILIALHRADVLTQQAQYDEAEALLLQLKQEAERRHQQTQLAYVLNSLGVLHQEQNRWEQAREYYERALRLAREAGSAGAEGRAQGHLADTFLHDGNASFAVHLLKEALPRLNSSGDTELSSYFAGRLGEGLLELGRKTEGQQHIGQALRLAEQMQHQQHEMLWRRRLAVEAMAEGSYAQARKHFMLLLAHSEASPENPDYILTLSRISKTCLRLGEYEAAIDYAQQAVDLVGEADPESRVTLLAQAAQGIALRATGQHGQSLPWLQAASQHYEGVNTTAADYSYVDVLRNLAAAYAETGASDTARQTYERALAHAQQQDSPLDVAGTQRDLGILAIRLGEARSAIEAWTLALEIYEQQRQYARVARLYCDIANLRSQSGQGKRAFKDYEQALMLLSSIDDLETRGVVLANAATAYVDQGDIETAESFFTESIKIAQRLQDHAAEATRRGNYGWFLLSTGRAQRALPLLTYARQQSQNLGLTLQSAVQTDNIGLAHGELGDYPQAVEHHREALEIIQQLDMPYWQAVIQANLAHSLIALDQHDEAAPLLDAALETGQTSGNPQAIIRALTGQAKIALGSGDIDRAGQLAEEASRRAEQAGLRRLLADALLVQAEAHARSGQSDLARENWQAARKLLELLHIPTGNLPDWLNRRDSENA
jgi:tetratricopeptide (TPR) repeat protein